MVFDSDDWVSENVLGNIVQSLKDCDILYFTRSYEENSDGITKEKIETMCHSSNGRELSLREYPHCVPFFIYSREFLVRNGLSFAKGIFHEDSLFTPVLSIWLMKYAHMIFLFIIDWCVRDL